MSNNAGLIIFDMDSTLIQIECIDQIASLIGVETQVAAITTAAMQGEIDFAESLRQRVALLKGVSEADFRQIFSPIPLTVGASSLSTHLRSLGWRCVVVSGGFNWFAQRLADELLLDGYWANELAVQQGKLTGELAGPIVDAQSKAKLVTQLQQRWRIPPGHTVAVGDGANDSLMLQAADVGIAFCAKPALQAIADEVVNTPDLMTIKAILHRHQLITD